MIELARDIVGTQPILAVFLAIGVGYLVGQVNLGGFSLGVGAVLFVGLAIGAFAPKASVIGPIGLTGLIMFLYGIGILYGRQFFEGMTGAAGIKYNALALIAVAASLLVALALGQMYGIRIGHTLGIFAGSMTSTATLQAALEVMQNKEPSIGYSIAYPFGVIGPILCIYFMTRHVKPTFPPKAQKFQMGEVTLGDQYTGRTLGDLAKDLPPDVQVTMVRKEHHNIVPSADTVLRAGDGLMLIAERASDLSAAAQQLGKLEPGRIVKDRSALDYIRVFASRRNVVGMRLGSLRIPGGFEYSYVQVRRGDTDLLPDDDLVLEFGDRIGVLCSRANFPAVRTFYGDSIKGTADFSYISIGVGATVGLLAGMVPVPLPGVGRITLGIAGVLLVALGLGIVRRTSGIVWTLPLSANLVLRNFGLTVFLAQVGLASGPDFAATIADSGFTFVLLGALIVFPLVLVTMLVGRMLSIPVDDLVGIVSGVTGNPAILAHAGRVVPTDRPDIGYAMILPSMSLVKILFVQIVAALLG